MTASIILLDRRLKPLPDEVQNVSIDNPSSNAPHQFSVRNAIEIARKIRINDMLVTGYE